MGFYYFILGQKPLLVLRFANILLLNVLNDLGYLLRVISPLLFTESFNLFILTRNLVQQELAEISPARVETGFAVLAVVVIVVTSLVDERLYLVLGTCHMLLILKVENISEIAFKVYAAGLWEAFVE